MYVLNDYVYNVYKIYEVYMHVNSSFGATKQRFLG